MNIVSSLLLLILYVGLTALIFYILYRVVRAAVRDGIMDAKKQTIDMEK